MNYTSNLDYNLERHIELLKFADGFRSKFGLKAFRAKYPDLHRELLEYSLRLRDDLDWSNRQQYFNFMKFRYH